MAATDGVAVAIVPASQPEVVDAARTRADARRRGRPRRRRRSRRRRGRCCPTDAGRSPSTAIDVDVPLRGVHNLRNAMLALAVARELGVSHADAARGIAAMPVPPMRVNWEQHGRGDADQRRLQLQPRLGARRDRAARARRRRPPARRRARARCSSSDHRARVCTTTSRATRSATAIELVAAIGEFASALGRIAPGDPRVITR